MDDSDPVLAIARERFGIPWLYPMQRLVMGNVLESASRDEDGDGGALGDEELDDRPPPRQVVILPTGAGKSLCFQIPALLLEGPTLVIYPLLALIEDQKRRLESIGIEPVVFRGGQEARAREAGLAALGSGRTKIAIATPEVLAGTSLLTSLAKTGIAHLAIDEAHCVSEWGESFRPAYLEIGKIAAELRPRAISAFTATASSAVLEAMAKSLFADLPWRLVTGDPDRPNISYSVLPTLSREHSLARLLETARRPLIVFASSRRDVERIALLIRERLREDRVRFYHAGLESQEKRAVEAWFLESGDGILVATCAYGMGVDKKNVRTVIHWELPGSIEAYLQESGRAGRDGENSEALLIVSTEEERRVEDQKGSREGRRRAALLAYARSKVGCRREGLLGLLGTATTGACSGCDRCEGTAPRDFEGAEEMLEFLQRNPRRFDSAGMIERLVGRPGCEPPLVAGSGLLADWRRDDLAAAIRALVAQGRARARSGRLWQGRLELSLAEKRDRGRLVFDFGAVAVSAIARKAAHLTAKITDTSLDK